MQVLTLIYWRNIMKQATCTFYEMSTAQDSFPGVVKKLLARVFNMLPTWYQRKVDRIRLAGLSPRLRVDAGIAEVRWFNEISKPFWEK